MSNITKKVTRNIPAPRQWWTSTDQNDSGGTIATGDIFKLNDSLNGPASEVVITTAGGSMSFRTNSVVQEFPSRPRGEYLYGESHLYIASGVSYTDSSQTPIVVATGATITLTGPINDLELCSVSGTFTLRAKR